MKSIKVKLNNLNIKRRILLVIASAVLVGTIAVGGTMAILTSTTNKVTNKFTPGNIRTEIEEDTSTYGKKDVYVVNTGKNDCKVRARVTVTPEDLVTVKYNTGDGETQWTKKDDGYYYYNGIVKAQGKSTNPNATSSLILGYSIDGVNDDGTVQNGKEVPKFDITVSQESIQSNKDWSDYTKDNN
jgi:hypothetical protein